MNTTPQSNRLHIGIFGETNAGKSSLFNALIETDTAIVSSTPGTTTDSVQKAIELTPFGPVVLIDTAGLGDTTDLGSQRMAKTLKMLNRVDFAIYVVDAVNIDKGLLEYKKFIAEVEKTQTSHILVITKSDLICDRLHSSSVDNALAYKHLLHNDKLCLNDFGTNLITVSIKKKDTINNLKSTLIQHLSKIKKDSKSLLGDLLAPGATVLMVMPIDSEAPKGRLILPQSQLIRDCLDNGFMAYVVTDNELEAALANIKKIDLVVTDSKVFGQVSKIVPPDIFLTSFSILMARQKGDIETLLEGIKAITTLKNNDKILVSEVCTHNRTHEDIGRVKIPAALQKLTGLTLNFKFTTGRDYPENLTQYALVIHCGACMITANEMKGRITAAVDACVPITNYGLFLAHASGVLTRSIEILKRK